MFCKTNTFRPLSCALSLLTVLAFICLIGNSTEFGRPDRSVTKVKIKQNHSIQNSCSEPEEEIEEVKLELPKELPCTGQSESRVPTAIAFFYHHITAYGSQPVLKKRPPYIVYHALII